jgi:F0F1-type ATP synthase membrane subunit c/vacuolar-type H+-ATPase subunit K
MRHTLIALFFVLIFLFNFSIAYGQEDITSTGVAISVPVNGENVEPGSVLCTNEEGLYMCDLKADQSMYGVVTSKPSAAFESDLTENAYLAVDSGKALVRVSGANGAIVAGDLVSSSEIPGVAVKADRNGYMLGSALDDFGGTTVNDTGTILVNINIHPSTTFTDDRSNLLELLREGLAAPLLTPLAAMRYLLAALVVVLSFVLAFIYFGRLARAAVEAIGRNPLAQSRIYLSVFLYLMITVVIVLGGLTIAYLILTI